MKISSTPISCFAALCFVFASLCPTTTIQTQAQSQHALIIGLSQYKEVAPLQFADRDATAFAEFLKTQHVPEENINLFLNQDATRVNIVDALYNLTQTLKPRDRFYFYFAGHGDLEAWISHENSLLLLYNSFKTGYFKGNEFLQLSELKTWFEALTKKGVEVVFIADACHSGGLIGGKEGINKTQQALQESWGSVTKILSCRADEYALEGKQWGGGRGLFSYHLVNGLTGRADANKDQKVSLGELDSYLKTNVVREANPNVQTPVILGGKAEFLSTVSSGGLARLADYERRHFPIITEVNLKGGDEKLEALLLSRLDTSLVSIYKQFSKALKEKRVASDDDSTDNALLHYRKLTASKKIPENLVQLMKRNMAVGLLDRELAMMKDAREKGGGFVVRLEKVVVPALRNLEDAMKLFGPTHYLYNFLQARALVLESKNWKRLNLGNGQPIDKDLKEIKEFYQGAYEKEKALLLKALQLEPNMISTHALLASAYRDGDNKNLDSSAYYQEKVVELLPNQGYAHLNLATTYASMTYTDANKKPAIHPKAIAHFEKTIALEPTVRAPYRSLGDLYMGRKNLYNGDSIHTYYHDYAKAIPYYEKQLSFLEADEQGFLKNGADNYAKTINSSDFSLAKSTFIQLLNYHSTLHFLHKSIKETAKAEEQLNKIKQKVDAINSVSGYMHAALDCYFLFGYTEDTVYLENALDWQQRAFKKAGEDLKIASAPEKPLLTLKYRELLKGMGAVHRALKNYTEAENYLQQALIYPIPDEYKGRLKLTGTLACIFPNKHITFPISIQKIKNGDYHYRIDVYDELFHMNWQQGKVEEAFAWLEKAFQNSVIENGNDISGKPYEGGIFEAYKNMDKERFLALKAKYFPPTEKK